MKYNRKMRNIMLWVCVVFAVVSVLFSVLQSRYPTETVFAILNNISVCILTGCLIALVQFIVGYHTSKYECLLNFYKSSLMLEEEIIHYPYTHCGFVEAKTGLADVRKIINLYDNEVALSFDQIDRNSRNNEALNAACRLYRFYETQIKVFREFAEELREAVRFSDMTDEQLIRSGICDIQKENMRINTVLQSKEKQVENAYNDPVALETIRKEYRALEKYLFGKTVRHQETENKEMT